jgi:trypsin
MRSPLRAGSLVLARSVPWIRRTVIAGVVTLGLVAAMTVPASAIAGGTPAASGQFGYAVSLSAGGTPFCTGVALDTVTVITAASCVDGTNAATISIRYDSLNSASGGLQVPASSIVVYPGYDSTTFQDNIAVVHTALPMLDLSPIALPASGDDPAGGTTLTVAGWGPTIAGGPPSAVLLTVQLPVISRADCGASYAPSGYSITPDMLCAGVTGGGKAACVQRPGIGQFTGFGDAGGPAITYTGLLGEPVLRAIPSWSVGCASPGNPGVYTRVGYFTDWIDENLLLRCRSSSSGGGAGYPAAVAARAGQGRR